MRGIERIRPAAHGRRRGVFGLSQQEQARQWRDQAGRQAHQRHRRAVIEQDLPLIGRHTHQPRQHAEIPWPAEHQQHRPRQQYTEEAEHQLGGKHRAYRQGDQRQFSINRGLLLPSSGNQQAQGQSRQYVQRIGILDKQAVRHLTDQAEQQQPAQVAPLTADRDVAHPMQIRRNRQAKPRERQAPRHIQAIQAQADIAQVIEHHAQQRQPLEQIQSAISDASDRHRFSRVHNSPMTLHLQCVRTPDNLG